jgi:hypothetical protein
MCEKCAAILQNSHYALACAGTRRAASTAEHQPGGPHLLQKTNPEGRINCKTPTRRAASTADLHGNSQLKGPKIVSDPCKSAKPNLHKNFYITADPSGPFTHHFFLSFFLNCIKNSTNSHIGPGLATVSENDIVQKRSFIIRT